MKQFESPQREDVPSSPSPRKSPGQDKVPFKSMRTSLELSKPFKNEEDPGQLSAPFSAIHLKNEVGEETSKKKLKILLLLKHLLHLILPLQVLHQLKVKDCSNHSKIGSLEKPKRRRKKKKHNNNNNKKEESAKHIESSQSDATISDNEKQNDTQNENLMNTVETSPPKDVNDEIISKPVQVQYPEQKTTHSGEQEVEKARIYQLRGEMW